MLTGGGALASAALGVGAGIQANGNMQALGYSQGQSEAYGAIVGIGAVAADSTRILSTFSSRIDPRSSEKAGMLLDADTVCWWLQQEEAARREIWEAKEKLYEALERFSEWVAEWASPEVQVWGNGSDFDNVIINGQLMQVPTDLQAASLQQ